MLRLTLIAALAIVPVLQAQPDALSGKNYAFLVGVSGYKRTQLKPLPFTPNDVDDFKAALLTTGFEDDNIKVLHDKQSNNRYQPEKRKIIKELHLLLDGLREQDSLIVALSGHGVHFKGDKSAYFCPLDAELEDKKSLIPMEGPDGIFDLLKNCKAKKKLLIVNACRNDPFSDLAQAARKADFDDSDNDEVPEGIAAIYSCRPGQKSYYDPDRKRGIFFDHVIRAWKGEYSSGSDLTIESFFEHVITKTKADVDKTLGEAQVPVVRREYTGKWKVGEGMKGRAVAADDEFIPLFNGKDLRGWTLPILAANVDKISQREREGKVVGFDGVLKDGSEVTLWRIEDGILIGEGQVSHLFTSKADYKDFVFRVEAQINGVGNSGLYFRSVTGERQGFPTGYEAQISIEDLPMPITTGSIFPAGPLKAYRNDMIVTENLHKADEWFTLEVTAKGNRLTVKLNGKTTIDWTDPDRTYFSGALALQVNNPRTVVKFRKIEVKELK